ncbi:MAG: hypothetical protein ACR2P9_02390 [Gammaproteobacteria bacterium]
MRPNPSKQTGAASLALVSVLLASTTWLLLIGLNSHNNKVLRATDSQIALQQAKQGLLMYAMNYPDFRDKKKQKQKGPGFLPCPDRKNDGMPRSNCAISTGTTLGRLPFRILGLEDLRDASGERLWYAVSNNFRNAQSNYAIINSETPGLLSVDGVTDIVAVIIAPGSPFATQSGRHSTVAADYLEADNATADATVFVTEATGVFNDQLIVITRAELMRSVEQRVLSELRSALGKYRDSDADGTADYDWPWLVPFADPNADYSPLRGWHGTDDDDDDATELRDNRRNFIKAGVQVNDIVRNATDGCIGMVTAVTARTLSVSNLSMGTDNDFDSGDIYYIDRKGLPDLLNGSAGSGSGGLTLRDRSKDFEDLALIPGDVVENSSDGSKGVIETVDDDTLVVKGLSGGTDNAFAVNDRYVIRSNTGRAAAGSNGSKLQDPRVNFITLGVVQGDLIENVTDGSYSRVASVSGTDILLLTGLAFGNDNIFEEDDVYRLARFSSSAGTRYGLLPVHQPGRHFPSAFSVDYAIATGSVLVSSPSGSRSEYDDALRDSVRSSDMNGTINIGIDGGNCIWSTPDIVECVGRSEPFSYVEGRVTTDAATLTDDTKDFNRSRIQRGDIVQHNANKTDPPDDNYIFSQPRISVVSGVTSATSLGTQGLGTISDWVADEYYRIKSATAMLTVSATSNTINFRSTGVVPGDIIEKDDSFSQITVVDDTTLTVELQDGTNGIFNLGDSFIVYYNYINLRQYSVNLRYRGEQSEAAVGGVRQRSVCLGCSAENEIGFESTVTLEDRDDSGAVLGRGRIVIPAGDTAYIKVQGLSFYFSRENGELPEWFIKNKWHKLVYLAHSSEFVPGGDGNCSNAIGDCLTVQGLFATTDENHVVLLTAGMELADDDRSSGDIRNYYEQDNAVKTNDMFTSKGASAVFNDQLRVVAP